MKKSFILFIAGAILLSAMIAIGLVIKSGDEYNIRITVPADSTEAFVFSDDEISPKGSTLTLYAGEGMGDGEIVLKRIDANGENAYYEPTYITPGMPVKMNAEKGAWYKIGINSMKKSSEDDIVVYITVSDVDVRDK